MGASPIWKVFSKDGEYLASFKYPEDAACLVTARGEGMTLRLGHAKNWTVFTATDEPESYDGVALIAWGTRAELFGKRYLAHGVAVPEELENDIARMKQYISAQSS